jgi:limonene-1,2-epoxide hydrolase
MTPEEVVRAMLAGWDHLDVDAVMSYFASDAVWDNVPIRAVSGHDEIRKEVETFMESMTSFNAEILNVAVAGNVVLMERVDHTHYRGRMLHARVMGAFEINGDKIKAWRDYFDMPKDAER